MATRRTTRQTTITSHFKGPAKRKPKEDSEKGNPNESAAEEREQDKKRRVAGTESRARESVQKPERVTLGTQLCQEEQGEQEDDGRPRRQTRELASRRKSREDPDREARPGTHLDVDDDDEKDKRSSRPRSQPRDLATKRRPKEAEVEQIAPETPEGKDEDEREEKRRKTTRKKPEPLSIPVQSRVERKASQGKASAIPKLNPPQCPECGQYLDDPDLKYQQHPVDAVDEPQMLTNEALSVFDSDSSWFETYDSSPMHKFTFFR